MGDAVLRPVSCPRRKTTDRWGRLVSVGEKEGAYQFGKETKLGRGPLFWPGQFISPRPFFFLFILFFFYFLFSHLFHKFCINDANQ
jgi:hypothetical protein